MGIYDAGMAIRDARIHAGLTQEQMAKDICSTVALSNIENGKCGVSPLTFSLLMNKAGVIKDAYPFLKTLGILMPFLARTMPDSILNIGKMILLMMYWKI